MQTGRISQSFIAIFLIAGLGCNSTSRSTGRISLDSSKTTVPASAVNSKAIENADGNKKNSEPLVSTADFSDTALESTGLVRPASAESPGTDEQSPDEPPLVQRNSLMPGFESAPDVTTPSTQANGSSPEKTSPLSLDDVLRSVYESYPLLQIAVEQRAVADGQLLESQGEFDLKLKGGGSSGALGFYQTNRYGAGFEQAMFGGGEVFAGYRIGRGNFQPWYGERETNDGGEFKTGFQIPLLQNRSIDSRRANIFRSTLGRDAVEPDILLQLIEFVRTASYSYWDWVAAGQNVAIEMSLLEIAMQRQDGLQKRADRGDLPRIELTDNQRLIASRRAALIESQKKYRQAAIKLSLFFRSDAGQPLAPSQQNLPTRFPEPVLYSADQLANDIQKAIDSRPEVSYLSFVQRQFEVDLAQARNLYLPEINFGLSGSQDVGAAASAKRDKSPMELETSMIMSVPLQRRKAIGKIQSAEARLAQTSAKLQFAREKISTEVEYAVAALIAATQRIEQARQSVQLNETMEAAERTRFDQGDSNLLMVNLREQATADARKTLVASMLEYHEANADFQAALASVPIPE